MVAIDKTFFNNDIMGFHTDGYVRSENINIFAIFKAEKNY